MKNYVVDYKRGDSLSQLLRESPIIAHQMNVWRQRMAATPGYLGCLFPINERQSGSISTSLLIHQEISISVSDHRSLLVWIGYPNRPTFLLSLCVCSRPHIRTRREEFVNRGEEEMRTFTGYLECLFTKLIG
jgi:hypothetical protein